MADSLEWADLNGHGCRDWLRIRDRDHVRVRHGAQITHRRFCAGELRAGSPALFALALVLGGTIGGYHLLRSDLLQADSERTREAVLCRIPLAWQISFAQTVMEAEGFRCRRLTKTGFAEDRAGGGPQVAHPPAHILWCDSGERITSALIVTKRWQVVSVDEGGLVSRIAVGVGLTGP